MRYLRTRRDENHGDIVEGLEGIGCSVVDLAAVGGGCVDLLVGYGGSNHLLEVKNPENRRRSGSTNPTTGQKQAEFRAKWKGRIAVVETVDEAIAAVRS